MNKCPQIISLLTTGLTAASVGAQDSGTRTDEWLEWSRPMIGVQLCDSPRAPFRNAFDGTTEECKIEVDRLFIKCTTEVPNVSLPATLMNMDEQTAAGVLLYECVSSHYVGGVTLEEFNRRYPLATTSDDTEPGD